MFNFVYGFNPLTRFRQVTRPAHIPKLARMATPTALASAGGGFAAPSTDNGLAQFEIGPNGEVLPATNDEEDDEESTPALPVEGARPQQQAQSQQPAPQVVRIGTVELQIGQVQPWLEQQTALLAQQREAMRPALQMYEAFQALPQQTQQQALDFIEGLAENPAPGTANLVKVQPLDLANFKIPAGASVNTAKLDWEDLSEGEQTGILLTLGLRGEFRELSRIVMGMRDYISQLHAKSADDDIATALRLYGITTDAAGVRKLRENGITDPIAAAKAGWIKPQGQKKTKRGPVDAPLEPSSVNSGDKTFNENDENIDPQEMGNLLARGYKAVAGPVVPLKQV